jgi:hypothetical protein
MKRVYITLVAITITLMTSCQGEESLTPQIKQRLLWKEVRDSSINITTSSSIPDTATDLLTPLFPVPITSVTKTNMKGYKWEVTSENGVVFYTNNKPKVGEVSFYMDGYSENLYWLKK